MVSAAPGPVTLKNVKSHARRDKLLEIQARVEKRWSESNVFEVDAPAKPLDVERFFGTFPYPYVNGLLHLGHAFTISKLEFASAYHRLRGEHVLLPFGFHCTGMLKKACADKLAYEIKEFGNPPKFLLRKKCSLMLRNKEMRSEQNQLSLKQEIKSCSKNWTSDVSMANYEGFRVEG